MKHVKVSKNGARRTYFNDELHSFNDEPSVITSTGEISWHCHGIQHRTNGPQFLHDDGRILYRIQGKFHNWIGPALVFASTHWMQPKYYIFGEEVSFLTWLSKNPILSDKEKVIERLKFV